MISRALTYSSPKLRIFILHIFCFRVLATFYDITGKTENVHGLFLLIDITNFLFNSGDRSFSDGNSILEVHGKSGRQRAAASSAFCRLDFCQVTIPMSTAIAAKPMSTTIMRATRTKAWPPSSFNIFFTIFIVKPREIRIFQLILYFYAFRNRMLTGPLFVLFIGGKHSR